MLGPIQVVEDGVAVDLGSPKQRAVLAVLIVNAGRRVSADRVMTAVWGANAVPSTRRSLQTYVSNLRALLDPGRNGLIDGSSDGYELVVRDGFVDWVEFERLARDPIDGNGVAALHLWRGPPLADVENDWARSRITEWEELRMGLIEGWADRSIDSGQSASVIAELERAVIEYPFRETLWARLMRALAATGRQAEALAAFQRVKRLLGEEMGIEPSPDLRSLEEQILLEDPLLGPGPPASARSQVPAERVRLIGRDDALAEVIESQAEHRMVTLHGPGGSGKTTLALAAARKGGKAACFVDFSPITEGTAVARLVADALDVVVEARRDGSALVDLLASAAAGRELLLVLDNCEHVIDAAAEVADALLAASHGIAILSTSREPLGIVGEVVYDVPPLSTVSDSGASPALSLLLERARAGSSSFAPTDAEVEMLDEVCVALEGMPLAIELAAAQLAFLDPDELASSLDDRLRMASRRRGEARHETLQATMEWSWNLLGETERRLLSEVTIFSGGWTLAAAEGVCTGSPGEVRGLLGSLVAKSLVIAEPGRWGRRYRLLDTVRLFAAGHQGDPGLQLRHARWFSAWVDAWSFEEHFVSGELASRLIFDWENLRSAFSLLKDMDTPAAVRLMSGFLGLWLFEHPGAEALEWTGAIDPADLSPDLRVRWLLSRGVAFQINRDFESMWDLAGEAAVLARTAGSDSVLLVALAIGAFGYLLVDLDTNENRWLEVSALADAAGLERIGALGWAMTAIGNDLRGGRLAQTRELTERAVGLAGPSGWDHTITTLAHVRLLIAEERRQEAEDVAVARIRLAEDLHLRLDVPRCHLMLAYAATHSGNADAWAGALRAAHDRFTKAWGDRAAADIVVYLAAWEALRGDPVRGSELLRVARRGLEYPESYLLYAEVRDHLIGLDLSKEDVRAAWSRIEDLTVVDVLEREFERLGW